MPLTFFHPGRSMRAKATPLWKPLQVVRNTTDPDCISDGSLRDVEGRTSSHSEFLVWNINSQAFSASDHAELKPRWRCIGSKKTTLTFCNNFNNHGDLAVGTLTSLRGQQVSLNDLMNMQKGCCVLVDIHYKQKV